MRKLMSTQEVNFMNTWTAVQPDIHSSDEEVESHGSQEGRGRGSWEGSEEECEANADHDQEENAVVTDHAASPV